MVAKISHTMICRPHQFLKYHHMHGESEEFFRKFLILKLIRYFWKEPLEVVSGQCEYCITLRIHILFHNF